MKENYNEILKAEILDCESIVLRRFTTEDAPDVLEYGSDELALQYLIWNGVKTVEQALNAINNYYLKNDGVFAIELKENKKCIGCIDIRLDSINEKAGFGYILNRSYWGRGYMTQALNRILKFCFEELELNRVEATHYAQNLASGKVMQKCGMVLEGVMSKEVKVKGVFQDVVHYGITKEMWEKLK